MSTIQEKRDDELTRTESTRDAPTFTPRFDILETESELTLLGDFPGVRREQLDIR